MDSALYCSPTLPRNSSMCSRRSVRSLLILFSVAACLHAALSSSNADEPADLARAILNETAVQGGFVVHLGAGDGQLTAALRANNRYQVHGLDFDPANVAKSREHIHSLGIYGDVAVDRLYGSQLPYIDNLANLIVAENLGDVTPDELMRVLAPQGIAYVKQGDSWKKLEKPRPDNIDEWTHFMHDASGNAVAHDDVVGPPRHLQWLGSPRWSRHHDRMASLSALVSSGGRIFYVMDEGSRISIQMPPKWTLIARDAFNGTVLWKKPISNWMSHLWPLKSGPTQMARRLVASGDRVYVTLGFLEPLVALDAATGKTVRTYEETDPTEEVIYSDDVLLALVNKGAAEVADFAPAHNVGDQGRVAREFAWNEMPREVVAVEASTGKVLWKKKTRVAPITLTSDIKRVTFHDGEKIVCLDKKTGDQLWYSPIASRRPKFTMNFGPKLVVHDGVVLFAGGDRKMTAYNAESGEAMWTAPHAQSGYQSPEDLLVAGGLVWNAPTTRTQDTGAFTGRDPKTGEVKKQFAPNVQTYWFHHRCYIAKATDKFLIPSRTGIEFVDPTKQDWDINHWVRGGCLYGVMPANGLTYAPPHNCACYPEAKLYGLNVLAPASDSRAQATQPDEANRLEKGPAFSSNPQSAIPNPQSEDWPTYRHDKSRSGMTDSVVPTDIATSWKTNLGGKLSAPTIAAGKVFVAQVDTHTIHAIDADSGDKVWSFKTGGRVDSPPTYDRGRLVFGSLDGWVYCLRASDGELAWRFRAAPRDQRLMAFEQLESVWPVHGSVLVEDDAAYFVAGRSNYLDSGLRWYKLNVKTGEVLAQSTIDEKDPETGKNLQERLQVLQMSVGLPDVLSADDQYVYMRSQKFDRDGKRIGLGPHSGQPSGQGSAQKGDGAHLFAPMGFLDDTYFHRAYWVYGRSFAGGHAGYYQAAKYTPSGRILVFDDERVYGYGRKPQYLRWTTTIEHQLFAADKTAAAEARDEPNAVTQKSTRRGGGTGMIHFENPVSLNPKDTPLVVSAWINSEKPGGVIVARGGPARGYALTLEKGRPQWMVREGEENLATISGKESIVGTWTHLTGVLTADEIELYINGQLAASGKSPGLITADPAQGLEAGGDDGGAVGAYKSPNVFMGTIDELRVFHGTLTADEIASLSKPDLSSREVSPADAKVVLSCSFDDKKATDASGNKSHGALDGHRTTDGILGLAMRFRGKSFGSRGAGSFVKHHWTQDLPLLVRAMLKSKDTLFVAGPPDLIDEEESFERLVSRDPKVQAELAEQNAALEGKKGGLLRAVSAIDGSTVGEYKLESLPVWDGLAAANGRLYFTTTDGTVFSLGKQ